MAAARPAGPLPATRIWVCVSTGVSLAASRTDRMDGELILVDGGLYQVKTDGKVYTPDPGISTPTKDDPIAVCDVSPATMNCL